MLCKQIKPQIIHETINVYHVRYARKQLFIDNNSYKNVNCLSVVPDISARFLLFILFDCVFIIELSTRVHLFRLYERAV